MSMHAVDVRLAVTPADYAACQEVQRAAWDVQDDRYIVPMATMVGAQRHGGLVLCAFRPDGQCVGFSFAFLGTLKDRLCLYSQLTGVHPAHQSQGVGSLLKHRQRAIAREREITGIAWAFDPLQVGNARFNIAHLRAIGMDYVPDMYGPRTDGLNRNTPTDRLIVFWACDRGPTGAEPDVVDGAFTLLGDLAGRPVPGEWHDRTAGICLEIPGGMSRIRDEDPARAADWLRHAREAFTRCFEHGYRVVGFATTPSGGAYMLRRGGPPGLSAQERI